LVVDDDDRLAVAEIVEKLLDACESRVHRSSSLNAIKRSTCFAMTSPSRLTFDPTRSSFSVVTPSVWGIRVTEKSVLGMSLRVPVGPPTSTRVRLTPSIVILPLG